MTKVCTTLALAAILLASCRDSARRPPATLLLTGGRILTLDSSAPTSTALAVEDGRIASLGQQVPATTVMDLHGAVVAPALVDHHVHLFNVGLALLNDRDHQRLFLDLSGVKTLDEVARLVQARAATTPAGGWIVGAGWNQAAWGTQALPTHDVLSVAAPDHPVFLARTDGHAGWVNARALELAAITAATPDPAGGAIVRLPSGRPSGVLLERANELVTPLIPPLADDDIIAAFRLAGEALAARGVVEAYDAGALAFPGVVSLNADLGRYLALLRRTDSLYPLPIRVNLMVPSPTRLADSLLTSTREWILSPRLRITHLKLFADGALGSRGAALTHSYADDATTHGVPRMATDGIAALARRALDAGLGVATHAIGDEAVKRVLDGYELLLRERPNLDPTRLRIEHFSYARDEDFARAVRLGIVLSIQSNFNSAVEDEPPFGTMRVGATNEPRVYAWDRLERMGAQLAEGSDYFARPAEALAGYYAALTRRNAVGGTRQAAEARRLAYWMQALRYPPSGGPVAPVLRPGAVADLVVLSEDPFTVPIVQIPHIRVLATISAGRMTYSSGKR